MTTCWTRSPTRWTRAGPIRRRLRSTAAPTAGTRRWSARRSRRTCSAARWISSARRTCRRCLRRSRPTGSRWRRSCPSRAGNPETDQEFLWSRSPLSRARDIRIPLLIAQGANDPRVKQAESEQIVAALEQAGIEHEYMLFPDEGHGFAKPENRLKFYAAAERFLARYLGGRFEE